MIKIYVFNRFTHSLIIEFLKDIMHVKISDPIQSQSAKEDYILKHNLKIFWDTNQDQEYIHLYVLPFLCKNLCVIEFISNDRIVLCCDPIWQTLQEQQVDILNKLKDLERKIHLKSM